ncbi:MmgE/PrpD family protein [Pigmentiphaga sp. H8]|uniref:MmgE/PrpD family protein n=1 Tax=Pigmentiphaga sp. H8 TaxID=2488560 RepID=UPI0021048E5A|nr:MmgE/PrpD family protein [Pigmentiphaga sp. H8]
MAAWASDLSLPEIPREVEAGATRLFMNILGCMVAGSRHEVVDTTVRALEEFFGAPGATLVGTRLRMDALNAAFLNALAASAHAFDDTHERAIVHPSAPVAAALLSTVERSGFRGAELLAAFVAGVEATNRVACSLSVPPARCNLAWMLSGVAGTIGAAVAVSRLLSLDVRETCSAIGLASSFSSGLRALHGTKGIPLTPAQACQAGLKAALLAKGGIDCERAGLETEMGLLHTFGSEPDVGALVDGLGDRYELLNTNIKPYPCGVVIHPVIDACVELHHGKRVRPHAVRRIWADVHPAAFRLAGNRAVDAYQARTSIPYWMAAVLHRGRADLEAASAALFEDPRIASLQALIEVRCAADVGAESARVVCELIDGSCIESLVTHAVGSRARPMTDLDVRAKFETLCEPVLGTEETRRLLGACRRMALLDDVSEVLPEGGKNGPGA